MARPILKSVTPKRNDRDVEPEDKDKPSRDIPSDVITEKMTVAYTNPGPAIENWTAPYLVKTIYEKPRQFYIGRFYPEIKLALDKFYSETEYNDAFVDFRREVLNKHGIRYMTLTPLVSFDEAVMEAEAQKVTK